MEKFKMFLSAFLGFFAIACLVNAQSQAGFISIDCGLPDGGDYTDSKTGLNYVSDASFVSTGKNEKVSATYNVEGNDKHLLTLRSFPEGIRNCYTVKPPQAKGNKFLIRARFFYGDYDSKGKPPQFDLYMGPNLWENIQLVNMNVSTIMTQEILHVPSTDYIEVCLVNIGLGTPLISSLEVRQMRTTIYKPASGSLKLFARFDTGSVGSEMVRYPDDMYDRWWQPYAFPSWGSINTSLTVDSTTTNDFHPPLVVSQTANTPLNSSEAMQFYLDTAFSTDQYYVYMHFAELEKLEVNQTRELNIFVNGSLFYGPLVPNYLSTTTIYTLEPQGGDRVTFSINRTGRSTLPPIINALEIYTLVEFLQSETDKKEVDALVNIKSSFEVKKNWQGDPCVPKAYLWEGLNCSYDGYSAPTVTAMNLSASGLKGEISLYIADLTSLEYLDLSHNNLSGMVPNFLLDLTSLRVLNLKDNKLTGPIPDELIKRSQSGLLELSVDGPLNKEPINNVDTKAPKKERSIVVPLVASFAGLFAVLTALATLLWFRKRGKPKAGKVDVVSINKKGEIESNNRQLTYAEVQEITNNFERELGRGGFGSVYFGLLDGTEVAVKLLSHTSGQGYQQFQAEVTLLMKVHHRNLTSLVGYCIEDGNMALIYEYMKNGDLDSHLSAASTHVLSWKERLSIAADAAQGLDYLHHGCKPPIVHRDIKSTNILLDGNFQAKLADFGLSRMFPNEGATSRISTKIAGTPGYLDPEYYLSNQLHEKSDVYSFGVVLLEIITSQPVINGAREKPNIAQWVRIMVERGDVRNIVDSRLHGDYDTNSAWKVIELALSCVSPSSNDRPIMNDVVTELKTCVEMELARKGESGENISKDSVELMSMRLQSEYCPTAR